MLTALQGKVPCSSRNFQKQSMTHTVILVRRLGEEAYGVEANLGYITA